jgi:hypothetical protein
MLSGSGTTEGGGKLPPSARVAVHKVPHNIVAKILHLILQYQPV